MPRTKSNSSKQINSSYQSLYLWMNFLVGMISLGIIVWNRRSVIPSNARNLLGNSPIIPADSAVIPAQAGIQENFVIPNAMRNLLPSYLMEIPRFTRDDSFSFASSLVLSTLTYQLTSSSVASLLTLSSGPFFFAKPVAAQYPEYQLDFNSGGASSSPVITGLSSGEWIAAFSSSYNGSYTDVYAQRYAANGQPIGAVFRVATIRNYRDYPAITSLMSGDWIVTWTEGTNGGNIYGQRFAINGSRLGTPFQVSSPPMSGGQGSSAMTSFALGGYVVVWADFVSSNYDIYAQRYAENGSTLGSLFRLNTNTTGNQDSPTIASLISGEWVVVWRSDRGLYGQRFAVNGSMVDLEFDVGDVVASSSVYFPVMTSLALGGWVVAWQIDHIIGNDSAQNGFNFDYDIYAQQFTSDGVKLGANFRVNSNTIAALNELAISGFLSGEWVIIWNTSPNSAKAGIYGQRFAANGSNIGSEFLIISNTDGISKFDPTAMSLPSGDWVVAWWGFQANGSTIYSIVFSSTEPVPGTLPVLTTTANVAVLSTNQTSSTLLMQQLTKTNSISINQTTSLSATQQQGTVINGNSSLSGTVIGTIAGASAGGFALAACLAAIGFYAYRKKSQEKQLGNSVGNGAGVSLPDKTTENYQQLPLSKSLSGYSVITTMPSSNYSQIDETKKSENEYDRPAILEI